MSAIDLPHRRGWVGRRQDAEQVLSPYQAAAMAGLLDREVAPAVGDALLLSWHWLYFLESPCRSAVGADGHSHRGGFLPPVPLPPCESAPLQAEWAGAFRPDPATLFRFSALTCNSHRIHYDRGNAVRQEFYPALVVHGPLPVALLLDLQQRVQTTARLARFELRAVRPAFDTTRFS